MSLLRNNGPPPSDAVTDFRAVRWPPGHAHCRPLPSGALKRGRLEGQFPARIFFIGDWFNWR